jgi:ABC-type transport system substrate-binding protein
MRKIVLLITVLAFLSSCGERSSEKKSAQQKTDTESAAGTRSDRESGIPGDAPQSEAGTPEPATAAPEGAVIIATDIVTEVIIRPDPEGDPWDAEKVAGYRGDPLVEAIFSRIYNGTLTVYDYHSGEPLTPADVKKIEGEFENDRTKIGKLSFTEEWFYYPEENRIEKRTKAVTFGYELYNNVGKVYAYRAAFRADLN